MNILSQVTEQNFSKEHPKVIINNVKQLKSDLKCVIIQYQLYRCYFKIVIISDGFFIHKAKVSTSARIYHTII